MLKTFRDIRETIGSFISILIVIFIGCFFFAGIANGSLSITKQVKGYYDSQNYATARAEYMFVNSVAVDEIANTEGVKKAAGYDTFYTQVRHNGMRRDLSITTLTDGIDDPYIVRGELPKAGAREMIVDSVFADKHGVKIGDDYSFEIATLKKIKLVMSGRGEEDGTVQYFPQYENIRYTFTVSGVYHSPDTIYKVNLMNTAAASDEFMTAYVNYGVIRSYTDDATVVMPMGAMEYPLLRYSDIEIDVFNGIKIIASDTEEKDLFEKYSVSTQEQLLEIFDNPNDKAAGLYMYSMERESFPAVVAFDAINDTIASLAAVLPIMFFAVAAAITVISLSKTVDNQRMQIGVIQALGVGKGSVYFSYIFYALFASLIGGLTGGIVGTFLLPYLMNILYARQFCMPPVAAGITGWYLLLGVVIAAALSGLSAFITCYRTLRVNPAQAMRPKPPKKTRRILIERWTGLWKRLGFGAKMNLRNMFLHKTKMLLSSVGIVGCIALLIALIGLKDNMAFSFKSYDASTGYDLTVVTDVAVDLEKFDLDEISDYEGAEYIEHLTFVPDFSGRFEFNGKTSDMTVMALPTAADAQKYKYADDDCVRIATDLYGKRRVVFDDRTFAIPIMLASEIGAEVGDVVKVSGYSLDNRAVEFEVEITHIVYQYFEQKAYCGYSMFAENGVGLYANKSYALVKDGVDKNDAIDALKSYDAVRDVKSFDESFAALEKQMSLLDYAVILFMVGAAALAVAVIYNITATNLKERTREIATLMVLGYKTGETANMLIAENMAITLLGCVLGLPLGYGLMIWLVDISRTFNVFISGFLSWYVAIGCVLLTFVFSLFATLLLNTRMKKISMVEALKSVE